MMTALDSYKPFFLFTNIGVGHNFILTPMDQLTTDLSNRNVE